MVVPLVDPISAMWCRNTVRCRNTGFALIVLASLAGSVFGDDPFARVREEIERAVEGKRIPSLAVAVARDGKIIWEEGFGFADLEKGVRATSRTPYSIASISKPVTATALMILAEQKRIDIDKPANEYLGDGRLTAHLGDANEATLRRLANHTAGLPLHYQFFYVDESRAVPGFDQSIRRYGHLLAPPGEEFQYANFGYGVLDHIVSRVSGRSFADFVREEVFIPLTMSDSSVGVWPKGPDDAAVRYGGESTPLPFYDFDHPGASAVFSSAQDLVRFGMFHLKQPPTGVREILAEGTLDEMRRPTADCGDRRHYGIGWFIDEDESGYETFSHTGGMGGVRCRLVCVPSEKIVVATLCNASVDFPLRMAREILAAMLPEYAAKLREEMAHRPNADPPPPGCPPELVGFWKGEVASEEGTQRLELWAQEDGDVKVRFGGELMTLLNESRLNDGLLTGTFAGKVRTADAMHRPHRVQIRLRIRGDGVMNGATTAMWLPGKRMGNALSYWTELKRVSPDPATRSMFDGHDLSGWRVLDEFDFERHGSVTVEKNEIILGRGRPATGIAWGGAPLRNNYELALEAKRIEGSDFFCGLTFPVGEDYLSLIVGGWGGGVFGLSNLDGMAAVENETTGYREFEQDRWYRLKVRVTPERVQTWIDDEEVINVSLKNRKLSIWWEQEPVRPLGIATWNTKAAIRNVHLTRLKSS